MSTAKACIKCDAETKGSKSHCEDCLSRKRHNNNSRRASFIAAGKCADCGANRDIQGKKTCSKCLASLRSRNQTRRKKCRAGGICFRCSAPATGKYCQACKALNVSWNRTRQAELHAEGKCVACWSARDTATGKLCSTCIMKSSARTWLGDSKRHVDLKQMLESQGYKCVYTGRRLEIGGNASIDHKIPRSRGGEDVIENLQWVDWQANRAKTDMTHDEFIVMCRLIVRRADGDGL